MINHPNDDTIAAISTAPGVGGIAVIRISGKQTIEIASVIFKPIKKSLCIESAKAYQAIYGTILHQGEEIDKVLVGIAESDKKETLTSLLVSSVKHNIAKKLED